jgi:hypothetical protein
MKRSGICVLIVMLLTGCVSSGEPKGKERHRAPDSETNDSEITALSETTVEPILYIILSSCAYRAKYTHWPTFLSKPGVNSVLAEFNATTDQNGDYRAAFRLKTGNDPWNLRLSYVPGVNTCNLSLAYNNGKTPAHGNKKYDKINKMLGSPQTITGSIEAPDYGEWEGTPPAEFKKTARDFASLIYPLYKYVELSKSPAAIEERSRPRYSLGEMLFNIGICLVFDLPPSSCR